MKVRVNHKSIYAATKTAEEEFAKLHDYMLEIATFGADYLKDTDPYQDRTGNLRAGTQALLVSEAPEIRVELEMDTEYASYVVGLGYSNFDEAADKVEREIGKAITGIGRRITR